MTIAVVVGGIVRVRAVVLVMVLVGVCWIFV